MNGCPTFTPLCQIQLKNKNIPDKYVIEARKETVFEFGQVNNINEVIAMFDISYNNIIYNIFN